MKRKKYPRTIINRKLNGKNLSIVGVAHTNEFLDEHYNFFEGIIEDSDALILERSIPNFNEEYEKKDPHFFSNIAKIAHSKNKRIYQVDQNTLSLFALDFTLGVLGLQLVWKNLFQLIRKNKNCSRKDFLKHLLLSSAGLPIFLGSGVGRPFLSEKTLVEYGIDDVLTYSSVGDYRNIKIAEGIERLCQEVDDVKDLVSIHGDAHSKTVDTYLSKPSLRKKKLLYLPQKLVSSKKIEEYTPTQEGWVLSRKF